MKHTHFYVEGTQSNSKVTIHMGCLREDGSFLHISNRGFKTVVRNPKWIHSIEDPLLTKLIGRDQSKPNCIVKSIRT